MKLDSEFKEYEGKLKRYKDKLKNLEKQLEQLKANTTKFLKICELEGIKVVGINTKTEYVKSSTRWRYGSGDVFADEIGKDGFPAIWRVCEKYDEGLEKEDQISCGCGNTGQYQILLQSLLIDGVYRLENDHWVKLKESGNEK